MEQASESAGAGDPGSAKTPPVPTMPAKNSISQMVLARVKNLNDMRKLFHQHDTLNHVLDVSPDNLKRILQQHITPSSEASRLCTLADVAVAQEEASRARDWVLTVLTCHFRLKMRSREHDVSLLRSAVEKNLEGGKEALSEKEAFYMAVTDPELATTVERLKSAFVVVLRHNLVNEVSGITKHAGHRIERYRRIKELENDMVEVHDTIVNKALSSKVDHFACAVPLSVIKHATADSDREGACPICQNSYTNAAYEVEELIADYPVRIKYCGHIVGKCCLERWMDTPKIDEAKYPYRTCPICRIPIEGVPLPPLPKDLQKHIKSNQLAIDTLYDISGLADIDTEDTMDAILACMSEEIALEELLKEAEGGCLVDNESIEDLQCYLGCVMDNLAKEKWAWGFRGQGAWKKLRDEWAQSGVIRKQ